MNDVIKIKKIEVKRKNSINNFTKSELRKLYILLINNKNEIVINKVENMLSNKKYSNIDLNLKIKLYRVLSRSYKCLNDLDKARFYFEKIKKIIEYNEEEIKEKDLSNYIMSLREYLEYNKEIIRESDRDILKTKLFKCLKENNIKPDKQDLKNNLNIITTSSAGNLYI